MTELIVTALLALAAGSLGAGLWCQRRAARHQHALSQLQTELASLQATQAATQQRHTEQLADLQAQLTHSQTDANDQRQQREAQAVTLATTQAELAEAHRQLSEATEHWKREREQAFQTFLTTTLEDTRQRLDQHAKHHQHQGSETLTTQFKQLVDPLKTMLNEYKAKLDALDKDHLSRVDRLDHHIKELTQAKTQLVNVLKTNKGAGDWGELELLRLLEFAGMERGIHYEYQETDSQNRRPDVKVYLPERGFVYVDAKTLRLRLEEPADGTPISPGLSHAPQDDANTPPPGSEPAFKRRCRQQYDSLKEAIKLLNSKDYASQFAETPDFVVLFVPRESMLSMALQERPALWEEAWQQNVVLATPLTLLALLRMVRFGWQQATLSQEVHEIRRTGMELHTRLVRHCERMKALGDSLNTVQGRLNEALTSLNGQKGLVSQVNKLEQLGCKGGKELKQDLKELALLPGD